MHSYEGHVSDDDLERYYLGMITKESDLAPLEEHLLACSACVARAEGSDQFVDDLRSALLEIGDLPYLRFDAERPANEPHGTGKRKRVKAAGSGAWF